MAGSATELLLRRNAPDEYAGQGEPEPHQEHGIAKGKDGGPPGHDLRNQGESLLLHRWHTIIVTQGRPSLQ